MQFKYQPNQIIRLSSTVTVEILRTDNILTHGVMNAAQDVGYFSDEATAAAFTKDGEEVFALPVPEVRDDAKPFANGFGVW